MKEKSKLFLDELDHESEAIATTEAYDSGYHDGKKAGIQRGIVYAKQVILKQLQGIDKGKHPKASEAVAKCFSAVIEEQKKYI